jgi:DNA-binding NarL/FixJ family response regulator
MLSGARSATGVARLLIIDDHEIARAGMRTMLATEPGWRVVGEAAGGQEGVALCRRLEPDLVLMDVRMPDMDGIAATRAILGEREDTRIIITTMYEDPDYLQRALEAGAVGFVLKDATRQTLIEAVGRALRGEYALHHDLASQLLRRLTTDTLRAPRPGHQQLTPRELDVLRLLAQGLTNRQIGAQLYISTGTVKLHVERILAKLDVADRTQAAGRAVELGLCGTTASPLNMTPSAR